MAAVVALAVAAGPSGAQAQANDTTAAHLALATALRDPTRANDVLVVLRSVEDADTLPLLRAAAGSSRRERRLFAVRGLRNIDAPTATEALMERLRNDPEAPIRVEAMLALVERKATTNEGLTGALRDADEAVQCIAARELVRQGRGKAAVEALVKLANSQDIGTAVMARLALTAAGHRQDIEAIRSVLTGPKASEAVRLVVLEQIDEDAIRAAAPLARALTAADQPAPVRLRAFRALAAVSPDTPALMVEAIESSRAVGLSVRLLRVLADTEGPAEPLGRLAQGQGATAALARFELARVAGGPTAADAAKRALALEHPVVIEYILARAAQAVEADAGKATWYADPLLAIIESLPKGGRRIGAEHYRAARAATLLGDLGTPEALEGLRRLLSEDYSTRVRAVAAGLLKTGNREAAQLLRPLLTSPYEELHADAMLALGRFGDPKALEAMREVIAHPDRHQPALVALSSWRVLKAAGTAEAAARSLAPLVK